MYKYRIVQSDGYIAWVESKWISVSDGVGSFARSATARDIENGVQKNGTVTTNIFFRPISVKLIEDQPQGAWA